MPDLIDLAGGLRFPEGPIAMDDGSVLLVEMFGPSVTRVHPDGTKEVVAEILGGPNGAAIGPDGAVYLCNNGGSFTPFQLGDWLLPGPFDPERYLGGSLQRLDLGTGELTTLYTECDGRPLRGPNDLVFDAHGGIWFTDHGIRTEEQADRTAICYAKADGSSIRRVVHPVDSPNGIGLSPEGDIVYWAETHTGRVWRRRITAPGEVEDVGGADPWPCLAGLPGYQLLDSLAVDGAGNVCVATLVNGGITVISPDGEILAHLATGDPITTNICFGGRDLRTAYITCAASGRLVTCQWDWPGLRLQHTA